MVNSQCFRPNYFRHAAVVTALFLFAGGALARGESNWPGWRGPRQDGHVSNAHLPVTWNADSVAWKAPLKGRGQSSPIIWGERIFLTSALDEGQKRMVFCLDRNSGKTLWESVVPWSGEPEKLHKMNSWATPSCVTDGKVVLAFFGRAGLHCYRVDGERLWSVDLGPFISPWGVASCPVLVDDMVIQNCDADEDAYICALDKQTGKILWRTPRPNKRGWSTPILVETAARRELVVNGDQGVTAYDPKTGKQLWFCKADRGRGTPTVTPGENRLYAICGLSGDMYAMTPGGEGDITAARVWHTPRRGGRDLPSPILIDNYLMVSNMAGVLTCYNAADGEKLWTGRLGGNYSATPIAANGATYFQDEAGVTAVVKAGPKLEIISRNSLNAPTGEIFRASLTPSEGQLFSRSDRTLYCIGQRQK